MLGNRLLQGEKVFLNAVTREDLPLFAMWFADLEFLSYLMPFSMFPQTLEGETEWYERMRKRENTLTFAIRRLDSGALLGSTSLMDINHRIQSAMFGIAVGERSVWGQGYGTDATRVIIRYGFMELNLNRIELEVYDFNLRAIKSYEKVGFKHEGVRRQAGFRDGRHFDILVMSILRAEWVDPMIM